MSGQLKPPCVRRRENEIEAGRWRLESKATLVAWWTEFVPSLAMSQRRVDRNSLLRKNAPVPPAKSASAPHAQPRRSQPMQQGRGGHGEPLPLWLEWRDHSRPAPGWKRWSSCATRRKKPSVSRFFGIFAAHLVALDASVECRPPRPLRARAPCAAARWLRLRGQVFRPIEKSKVRNVRARRHGRSCKRAKDPSWRGMCAQGLVAATFLPGALAASPYAKGHCSPPRGH